uniref:Uncharacterized protein n=1 Tax=Anguilla anguilla TaxID=7936 RepID=A0A0E9XBL4_ANGAN
MERPFSIPFSLTLANFSVVLFLRKRLIISGTKLVISVNDLA